MTDNLTRWRAVFYGCCIVGVLGLVAAVFAAAADSSARRDYEAMVTVLGPRNRPPPEPAAPTVFRVSWQILLVGLLGSIVAHAAEVIVGELRATRGAAAPEPDAPPPSEPGRHYSTLGPPAEEPRDVAIGAAGPVDGTRRPPKLR